MSVEKKTVMTNEEVLERLKEILKANGWKGADFFMEKVFHDHIFEDSYYYVRGFIDAMEYGGILSREESSSLVDSLIKNRFESTVSVKKGGGSG